MFSGVVPPIKKKDRTEEMERFEKRRYDADKFQQVELISQTYSPTNEMILII